MQISKTLVGEYHIAKRTVTVEISSISNEYSADIIAVLQWQSVRRCVYVTTVCLAAR